MVRGNKAGTLPNNWYLRNEFAVDPDVPVDPNAPVNPDDPSRVPNFRPGVSLYSAVPPMAAVYGRHLIDTLHERVGEQEQLKGRTDLQDRDTFNGAWGRIIGNHSHRDGESLTRLGAGGPEYDLDFGALQSGMDFYRNAHENGARTMPDSISLTARAMLT